MPEPCQCAFAGVGIEHVGDGSPNQAFSAPSFEPMKALRVGNFRLVFKIRTAKRVLASGVRAPSKLSPPFDARFG